MIRHIVFFSMKPEALERDGLANAHAMAEHLCAVWSWGSTTIARNAFMKWH